MSEESEKRLWGCHCKEEEGEFWGDPEFLTREEAIAAGRERYPGAFDTGRAEVFAATADEESFLNALANSAWEYDEVAEPWVDDLFRDKEAVEELRNSLQDVLDDWLERHKLTPSFFIVREIERWSPPC